MLLSREGIICGPSSGITLQGLYGFLQKAKDAGTLEQYREPETGEISCVFVCSDLPYQYLNAYFDALGEEDFPPIRNEVSATMFNLNYVDIDSLSGNSKC